MARTVKGRGLLLGFLMILSSFAPAPAEKLTVAPPLLERRYKAALKLYDVAWIHWREKRVNAGMLYHCSELLRRAEIDLNDGRAGRRAAMEAHVKRFQQMDSLLGELKRKGLVTSSFDIASAEFFKLEIEHELELEKVR